MIDSYLIKSNKVPIHVIVEGLDKSGQFLSLGGQLQRQTQTHSESEYVFEKGQLVIYLVLQGAWRRMQSYEMRY
jgi:hypothetical protein